MQANLVIQRAKAKHQRTKKEAEQRLNESIPAHLCMYKGLCGQPCRRKRADSSCRLLSCGYNVATNQLPLMERELLSLAYNRRRRN